MYTHHKFNLLVITIVSYLITILIPSKFFIFENLINNSIIFLSIIVGFYAASISVIFTSDFINKKYSLIQDSKKKNATLLDTLINYFKIAFYSSLSSAIALISYSGLNPNSVNHDVSYYLNCVVIPLLVMNGYQAKIILEIIVACIKYQTRNNN